MKKITDKDFLYCYDVELFEFFRLNGIHYILKARSIKDGKVFVMYQKTDEVYQLLSEYNSISK